MTELDPVSVDTLGEIGNIMMGAGATNLATLLGERVDITAPEVVSGDAAETWADGQVLMVDVSMIGALSGDSVFVLPAEHVETIVEIMCAGTALPPEELLGEMGLAAVGEAMNQLMAGSAIALSDVLGELVDITPPVLRLVEPAEIGSQDDRVRVRFDVKVGDRMQGELSWLLHIGVAEQLVARFTASTGDGSGQGAADRVAQSMPAPSSAGPTDAATEATAPSPGVMPLQPVAPVSVSPAAYPELGGSPIGVPVGDLALLADVAMSITVELGRTRLQVRELLELAEGSVVELDRPAGAPVDILVNGTLIARGDVVVVDDELGVRVSEVLSPESRRQAG